MKLWRISNHVTLAGEGGLRAPARWHNRGRPIVYLAESAAGAMLETLVHLQGRRDKLPRTYTLLAIVAPAGVSIEQMTMPTNADWKKDLPWSRERGDEWLRSGRTALLEVPSVIMPRSRNFLLNPLHADAILIQVEEVIHDSYDERLFLGAD